MITFSTRQWSDEEFSLFSGRHYALRFCMYLYFSGVTSQSECPHGWTRRDSSCYLFVTHVANDWTESEVRAVFIFNLVGFFQFYILSYFTFMFIHVNSVVKMWAVENMHFSLKKNPFWLYRCYLQLN